MQFTAILLPADTPVIRGRELPLKVHCGPALAACAAPVAAPLDSVVVTRAAAPTASVSTDVIRSVPTKRMSFTSALPVSLAPNPASSQVRNPCGDDTRLRREQTGARIRRRSLESPGNDPGLECVAAWGGTPEAVSFQGGL